MAVNSLYGAGKALIGKQGNKKIGNIGYDNPRQNIDPNIVTRSLTAQEIHVPGISSQTEETFDGSECSGISGAESRTLTLSNSSVSSLPMVWLDGILLRLNNQYTIVNNAAASVITFTAPVWDDQYIIVRYNA